MIEDDMQASQHPALDFALGQHMGQLGGRLAALEAQRKEESDRLRHVEAQVAEVRAEQAAARATREAQHAETMAQIGAMMDRLTPLAVLPGEVRELTRRLDKNDHAANARTISIGLPDPSMKGVIATIAGAIAIAAFIAALFGWRPHIPGA